jgi:hypothetical protein
MIYLLRWLVTGIILVLYFPVTVTFAIISLLAWDARFFDAACMSIADSINELYEKPNKPTNF